MIDKAIMKVCVRSGSVLCVLWERMFLDAHIPAVCVSACILSVIMAAKAVFKIETESVQYKKKMPV